MCQRMIPFVIKSPRYFPPLLLFSYLSLPAKPSPLSSLLSLLTQIQISMRAGSLLVWDSRLPHGNYPNESDKFRMVQCISSALSFSFLLFCFPFLLFYILFIFEGVNISRSSRLRERKRDKRDSILLSAWMMHQVLPFFSVLFSSLLFSSLLFSSLFLVFFLPFFLLIFFRRFTELSVLCEGRKDDTIRSEVQIPRSYSFRKEVAWCRKVVTK